MVLPLPFRKLYSQDNLNPFDLFSLPQVVRDVIVLEYTSLSYNCVVSAQSFFLLLFVLKFVYMINLQASCINELS